MSYLISSIKRIDDKLEISFDNKKVFLISKENYFRFDYLYEGKTITEVEYNDLINYEKDEAYRAYLRKLLKQGNYSSYQCVKRLIERKELPSNKAYKIVQDLIKEGYIDDERYLDTKIEILKYQNLSPKGIINYLTYEAHIDKKLIDKYLDKIEDIDEDSLNEVIGEQLNRNLNIPLKKRKEKVINYLLRKQYSLSFAKDIVDTYIKDNSIKDDVSTAYMEKLFRKYLIKYDKFTLPKKKKAIYQALIQEGLDKDDFVDMLDEIEADEEKIYKDAEIIYNKIINTNYTLEKKIALFTKKMVNLGYTLNEVKNIIREEDYDFE